ncbi:hypothetical protein M885DRAFT_551124 [Pelagophyceae sp. CCMP2097]|nr:hypothetical protein M885DRAFT_551124 [Pelagophyceae sp. CCMP2097]|mmetsp:Transcript_8942/g.29548  ORF Transcript_8942/g.29548 Transcript_8942/m.29548 type:complete len:296 (-) Transcript_8942:32-919(-)
MHGRKKTGREKTEAEVGAEVKRAQNYKALTQFVWDARGRGATDERTLGVITKLLSTNTDEYTLWNYRREILVARGGEKYPRPELDLTAICLAKQPKSYPSWAHRLWVVRRAADDELCRAELALCAHFLADDERNFHCWNYRRDVAKLLGLPADEAAAFAQSKLEANFSNYSAFHELYAALPETLDCATARAQLDMAAHALFTEPDDQSAWWYHSALLDRARRDDPDGFAGLAATEAAALRELRALEPASKWATLALLRLLLLDGGAARGAEVAELHAALAALDPQHACLYALPAP